MHPGFGNASAPTNGAHHISFVAYTENIFGPQVLVESSKTAADFWST